jgi:hypothetical protein
VPPRRFLALVGSLNPSLNEALRFVIQQKAITARKGVGSVAAQERFYQHHSFIASLNNVSNVMGWLDNPCHRR